MNGFLIPKEYAELKEGCIIEKDDLMLLNNGHSVQSILPWFVGSPYKKIRGFILLTKKDNQRSKIVNTSDRSTLRRWIDTAWYNNARCLRVRTYHQSRRWARMAVKWEHDLKGLDNA